MYSCYKQCVFHGAHIGISALILENLCQKVTLLCIKPWKLYIFVKHNEAPSLFLFLKSCWNNYSIWSRYEKNYDWSSISPAFLSPFQSSILEVFPQAEGARYSSLLTTVDKDQSEKNTDISIFNALFTSRELPSLIMTLSNAVIYFMIWSRLPGGPWIIHWLRLERYFYAWATY